MSKETKVLTSLADLKVIQQEKVDKKVSAQVDVGAKTVVAFFQEIKLDDQLASLQQAAIERDKYYVDESEYHALLREKKALIEQFESIPVVIEKRAVFKELHEQMYGTERPAGNGRLIPIVPPSGELSTAYNELQNELAAAEKVYQNVVLVEVESQIFSLVAFLRETNLRKVEQGEWDAGKK